MELLSERAADRKWSSKKTFSMIALFVLGTFTLSVPTSVANMPCSYGDDLIKVPGFGDDYGENQNNPGKLKGYYYKPDNLPPNSPLVVALHGCGQKACDYDDETGWKALAQRYKFALLFPEQQKLALPWPPTGNPATCFSWWETSRGDRNLGEPKSIMNMIKETVSRLESDPQRIYITGLSGGGAMTVTMLADYPDCFAGGAPMAGVPFGCTVPGNVSEALSWECMCIDVRKLPAWLIALLGKDAADYEQKHEQCMGMKEPVSGRTAEWWSEQVRKMAYNAEAKWPRISIWQGAKDDKVAPINLERLMLQWTDLHGLNPAAGKTVPEPQPDTSLYDIQHTTYADASGRVQVETYLIKSKDPMQAAPATGHSTAVDPDAIDWKCGCASVDCACETRGVCNNDNKLQYIQDANICSSLRVAQFWGLDRSATPSSGQRCRALRD